MKPNETNLKFYANGFNAKSSYLSVYIEKCSDDTKQNPYYKNLSFHNIKCAKMKEIDEFVNKLNVEIHFKYYEIDIQERNMNNTIFQSSKMIVRSIIDSKK